MEGLLEIDSLSEQDRDIILQVLKRDDEVRKTQELKANQLKVEIQSLRMQSVLRPGDDLSKMCARCHSELGVIFNRGDICPKCRFRVCNHCKETMFKGSWLCNLCFKQRQLKLLTGEWAGGPSSGLKQSGTDLVKASIIYKDHPPLGRKQDVSVRQSQEQVLQRKQGVMSSSNNLGPRAIGGQEIRKSPAKAANNTEVQKEHTNGVISAQETERVEYPKETDKQRLSQLLNFIRAKKPLPVEAQENSREMSVRRITSRNYSESSESSSSETDDDIGSSYHPSLRSSSVSPPISEVEYDVQMSESARLQSVREENINTEGDGRNQVVKPELLEQLTLELSPVNVPSRDKSPKEKSKNISDHQKSNTEPDVSKEERHVKSSPSSLSGKSDASAKMSMITTSCEVHTSTQSYQPQLQITAMQGDSEIQSRITSADLPLGRSSSPISVSMDSLPSSHPSPSMSRSNIADLLEKGSMHDTSDTESISRASQPEMMEFSGTESVVREGSADDDYVLEEISKVKFRRISQPSKHSEGKGPRFSHSPQRPSRPEGFTAEVEGPWSHSGLLRGSEQFEEGRKQTECWDPFQGNSFTDLRSDTAGKVSYELSIKAVDVDTNIAQDSEFKISQLSQLQNIISTAFGTDPSPHSNAPHPHQFTGSHLSNPASHGVHGSCIDVVNSPACDNLSGDQSSIDSHLIKHKDISSKDYKEITKQKGSKVMTLLDATIPTGNRSVSERSVSEADSIGSFNLSPMSPISPSSFEANTGVYTITYFDSDDALEDPTAKEPENDDYVIQWTEELKSAQIDEIPQILKLDKGQNRCEVPREIDSVGIKEKLISDCSSLWYVQGVDASKEEFDSLFNQEEKIMKRSKGGYLTRSSSEDSDVLSIIDEKDEEEENRLEDGEERQEQFSCNAYSANEGGMSGALQPNNKSAFVCKKQQSCFLDVPEIRDSSSVVFAEHSVKINQEVSNEESFISLDPSSIPDISLDDILAVNRNMSAVGDSDDGDLEEILAYYRDSHQESSQTQKLPKTKKPSDITSLDISQMKKAIKEEAAEKEQVCLSGVSQHPHELTVFAGKEFSSRSLVEHSILNENTCIKDDAAKSVSDKMEALQHPTEVTDIKEDRDDSRAVSDEKSLSQVRAEHPDEVITEYKEITLQLKARPVKEEKQIHDITEVHPYSEFDNLFSDLKIEGHKFSENLNKNCCRSPTDQSSEKLEHQISIDQNTSERPENQISIDQDTRITPHEEEVEVEQVVRAKTSSTYKLSHERAVIEESSVVQDLEECERTENITERSGDYLSLEGQVNSAIVSAFISEQVFVTAEPFCIDYVIQPPEEFSDAYHMATSSASQHVASQTDADYLSQHQAPQEDADYLSQHQATQEDADYLSQHVPEDDADAEIRLILKDPQTLEKVETLKKGENWDDMHVKGMKAEVVLTLSSGSENSSEEFVGKIGEKETSGDRASGIPKLLSFPEVLHSEENIVNKTDSTFHPPQNSAEPQDGKDEMFSFQESSKACFTVPMIDVDIVDTEKRTSPLERSESSNSQEDSGHVSLPTSVDHTPEHKRTDSGYSQSSIPSTRSTATDRSEEEDIDTLVASAKSNISSRGNLLSVIADSRESIVSYYSDAGDISHSNIPVTGEVLFGLNYNYKTGMLEIAVKQCKDVAPADTKRKRSDPYVKTYLLPDKTRSGKRKTKVKKHTLSPIFDEVLKYSVSKSELENRTLWLSVWHNDRFGRNDFLGEVTINFDYYKFDDPTPRWYPLQERMDSQQPSMLTYKGDLILSISFVTTADNKKGQQNVDSSKGQLHVMIKEAHNLTAVKSNGYSDPFCKGYLLPERHRSSKQKTPVVKKNCNPVWNYKMVFEDMSRAELAERCLELTIWDHEKLASNDFLGGVRLNLGTGLYQGKLVDWMDSKGEEISLWQAMLDRPNLWIDSTLVLRPNMQKRKF